MQEDNIIELHRYEVASIINDNRTTLCTTNDITMAEKYYKAAISKYINDKDNNIIIFIFDYNKNCNIDYYDNRYDY